MNNSQPIENDQDFIGSDEIIKRIKYLESLRDDFEEDNEWSEWEESDECLELESLIKLAEQAEPYAEDWKDGSTLIRDSYMREYVEEWLYDVGILSHNFPYIITNNLDWDGVVSDFKQDYTKVDFDGVAYWIR